MRLVTFIKDNTEQAGVLYNGSCCGFADLLGKNLSMLDFIIEYENKPFPDFPGAITSSAPLRNVKLAAPIPNPFRSIICLGKNYVDHVQEVANTIDTETREKGVPAKPVYFAKNGNPAKGHGDIIPLHGNFTGKVDYEAELAVIIGKTASKIEPKDVENVVFGYTVLNDITARDVQIDYGQWYLGKSLDGFCSIGPCIVTKDEIPFPVCLNISCRVNGETRQASNTSLLIYDIPRVISELSQAMTLYPGDIISTGTPGGIGHAKNPPEYLRTGDIVECEIEKIGILANTFE